MRRLLSALALAGLLAGCASGLLGAAGVQPGETRQQVLARIGNPTAFVPLAGGGERLQYSGQPFGQYAWMVDLDPSGKVASVRQVLNANDFNRIVPGQWTRADVEREFGPPALVERVSSWAGPIYTYRWMDRDRSDMFYFVYFDGQDRVGRAHQGMEYRSAPNDHD